MARADEGEGEGEGTKPGGVEGSKLCRRCVDKHLKQEKTKVGRGRSGEESDRRSLSGNHQRA